MTDEGLIVLKRTNTVSKFNNLTYNFLAKDLHEILQTNRTIEQPNLEYKKKIDSYKKHRQDKTKCFSPVLVCHINTTWVRLK